MNTENPPSEKDLNLRISQLNETQRERYFNLLIQERGKAMPKGIKNVGLKGRYQILDAALEEVSKGSRTFETSVDPVNMKLHWNKAGGDKNPPTKGAILE